MTRNSFTQTTGLHIRASDYFQYTFLVNCIICFQFISLGSFHPLKKFIVIVVVMGTTGWDVTWLEPLEYLVFETSTDLTVILHYTNMFANMLYNMLLVARQDILTCQSVRMWHKGLHNMFVGEWQLWTCCTTYSLVDDHRRKNCCSVSIGDVEQHVEHNVL